MTVKFSLAHLTVLGTTPLELIRIAADSGYDYASVRMTAVAPGEQVTSLVGNREMVHRVSKLLHDTGVQVLDVELARLGPDDEPEKYLGVLEAAAAIGARHVLAQLPDPDRDRAIERFGRLCDRAFEFGLTVDLEFPSWSEIGDLEAAAAVVTAVDRSNAGILVDTLHFFRSESSIAQLVALPPQWFRFVQLCDGPADSAPTIEGVIHTARCGAFTAGLWPPAARRVAPESPRWALLAGGPERRVAWRTRNDRVRPARPGHRSRGRRRLWAPRDGPVIGCSNPTPSA